MQYPSFLHLCLIQCLSRNVDLFGPPEHPLPSPFPSPQISHYPYLFCRRDIFRQVHLKTSVRCNEVEQPCGIITNRCSRLKWASDDKPILQHISPPPSRLEWMTHRFQHCFSEGRRALLRVTEREGHLTCAFQFLQLKCGSQGVQGFWFAANTQLRFLEACIHTQIKQRLCTDNLVTLF